jgi:hypothetical protein
VKCLKEKKHLLLFVGSRIEKFVKKEVPKKIQEKKRKISSSNTTFPN